MDTHEPIKVGKRGTVVIPALMRRQYQIEVGSLLIAEARPEGILLRPAAVSPIEVYSPERKAEFLLQNAVSSEDYQWARAKVRELGLDPDEIDHEPPR